MSKRINIIARYNENLDWVENLDGDVLIFNKGENYIWPYEVINVENYGREAETYVNAIIHLFETKKINKYDELVFLQGNPTEHYNLLFEALKKENQCPAYWFCHCFIGFCIDRWYGRNPGGENV